MFWAIIINTADQQECKCLPLQQLNKLKFWHFHAQGRAAMGINMQVQSPWEYYELHKHKLQTKHQYGASKSEVSSKSISTLSIVGGSIEMVRCSIIMKVAALAQTGMAAIIKKYINSSMFNGRFVPRPRPLKRKRVCW